MSGTNLYPCFRQEHTVFSRAWYPDVVWGVLMVDNIFREWANSLQAEDLRMLTILSWKVVPAVQSF